MTSDDPYLYPGTLVLKSKLGAKGGHQFQFRQFIETGMADVHRRLERADFLRGLSRAEFAEAAGAIMGDVNYVHPFREGNGRTQLQYLAQLAGGRATCSTSPALTRSVGSRRRAPRMAATMGRWGRKSAGFSSRAPAAASVNGWSVESALRITSALNVAPAPVTTPGSRPASA